MYMVAHDIMFIAQIATPTNWTRYRCPFAVAVAAVVAAVVVVIVVAAAAA